MLTEELSHLPLFKELTQEQLNKIAPVFWRITLAAGETIFSQGDEARSVYVIESGEVVLRFFPEDGGSVDIETITKDGVFGWSAALGRQHYTSSAICLSPIKAIATNGNDLRRVMRSDKELSAVLIERMAQVVAHRLHSFRTQIHALLEKEENEYR
ncbi:MAG: cyclic nucleotide-binding domain-containing protein [Chloroflexi bacterium]|nr:cyclic nucleotide-binding domain-containing protein [Chloroflexota bacterium]